MGYKKVVVDGYILGIGVVEKGGNIDSVEYDKLSNILENMPIAPDGFYYGLREDETWVLVPIPEDEDIDDAEALQIILGGDES